MESYERRIFNEYFDGRDMLPTNNDCSDIDFNINWYLSGYQQTEYYDEKTDGKQIRKNAQRQAANMRERKRMKTINDAFERLRAKVPFASESDKKLSKVDTLRLAVRYIQYLAGILESCGVMTASKRKRMGESNGKVILICSNSSPTTSNSLLIQPIYGHSLSWNIESQYFNKKRKFTAQIWFPHRIDAQEQAELSGDFHS
ncbi:unnamed protein product [Dimorphilus gyrociliatus]|uniref:BHLH domain-containing protein n=1 Tax=Dimorphilus gyrociliatus TaxID=2664684 RepID=A0A7I8VP76_9ANNE|nr:unnamed protein product [Dimorphilus gyrociliatus]